MMDVAPVTVTAPVIPVAPVMVVAPAESAPVTLALASVDAPAFSVPLITVFPVAPATVSTVADPSDFFTVTSPFMSRRARDASRARDGRRARRKRPGHCSARERRQPARCQRPSHAHARRARERIRLVRRTAIPIVLLVIPHVRHVHVITHVLFTSTNPLSLEIVNPLVAPVAAVCVIAEAVFDIAMSPEVDKSPLSVALANVAAPDDSAPVTLALASVDAPAFSVPLITVLPVLDAMVTLSVPSDAFTLTSPVMVVAPVMPVAPVMVVAPAESAPVTLALASVDAPAFSVPLITVLPVLDAMRRTLSRSVGSFRP